MVTKAIIALCCVLVAVVADEKYTDKYDNIDIDEILGNDKLLIAYINCLLGTGKCTPEGKELKTHLQDGLETGCAKCTEKQEGGVITTSKFLIKNKPEYWKELTEKYDPEGKFKSKYEERARAEGIILP